MKTSVHFPLFILLFVSQLAYSQYVASEWEDRDTWMDVNFILDEAAIASGSYVADIGCHEGYLTIHLANRVEANGRVFAVDVREDRLETLEEHLEERKLDNVNVILGDYDNPKLPEKTLDVVIIMDTYHEMVDYMTILDHVYKSLKPGGRIVIVEKFKSRIKGKTRDEQTDAHSLGPEYVKEELTEAGFYVVYENNDLGDWEEDPNKVIWMLIALK